jgi:cobaltochelatase CobT
MDLTQGEVDLSIDAHYYSRKPRPAAFFTVKDNSAAVLANQVRKYVQAQSRVKFRAEQEHGKLNSKDVTRLLLPPIDGGNWNRKVFYDRTNKRHLNTAVHILVDWSGSMNGNKQKFAAAACIRATEVFGRCLRMPVMVSSFTVHKTQNDIAIIKHFGKPATPKAIATRFGKWVQWTGGNNDGDSVLWAYRRLMERKEPRKLLIVMSDGAPADSPCGRAHDALTVATRQIQDEGKVELFGLGIMSSEVESYYDNYQVVWKLEDINKTLLDVLKGSISYEGR